MIDENTQKERTSREFMFKARQPLGVPQVVIPPKAGYVQAIVQFIVAGLNVSKHEEENILSLCNQLGIEIVDSMLSKRIETVTKHVGTLVEIAFYVPSADTEESLVASINDMTIAIVERFIGLLSFLAGVRLVALHTQANFVKDGGTLSKILEPIGRSSETQISFDVPESPLGGQTPSNYVFIALFWLRRAMAERDPLDTYAAFMVSLQAIAREVVHPRPVENHCPECGQIVGAPGVTAIVRELVVDKLGATPERFKELWDARNKIVAHGNKTVDAGTFLKLTELKFEAAELCYKGIKLAMNLPIDGPPKLDQSFFVTSALMYVE